MSGLFVCTTGKSIEPADLVDLVKGVRSALIVVVKLNGELADRRL